MALLCPLENLACYRNNKVLVHDMPFYVIDGTDFSQVSLLIHNYYLIHYHVNSVNDFTVQLTFAFCICI